MSDQDIQSFEEIEAELQAARDDYEAEMASIGEEQARLKKRVAERIDAEETERARGELPTVD